jgi:hypothetical protein
VTVTCFDQAGRACSPELVTAYQPVLILADVAGARRAVGVAALRCDAQPLVAPSWDVLAAVGRILSEQATVVSILA